MLGSDENNGYLLCIAEIFEAISDKEEAKMARCLEKATIETALLFEATYGVSPLVWCLRNGGMNHLCLVHSMLASGLYDCEIVDGKGRTVLAGLVYRHADEPEFVESVIKHEIEGIDDTTACYKILKHDSLELFKLFLSITQRKGEELFQCLANAVTQLKIKKCFLSQDLRIYVQWKLADYGFRYLSGPCTGPTGSCSEDWKHDIDVISGCWRIIAESYDTGSNGDIDDRLLHLLTVIHNHLYFLQHKQCLKHLPMTEIIFSLAIFLTCFRNIESFLVYRFMIHKCLVVKYVRMISSQLNLIKQCLECEEMKLTVLIKEMQTIHNDQHKQLKEQLLEKIKTLKIPCKPHLLETIKATCHSSTSNKIFMAKMKKAFENHGNDWIETAECEWKRSVQVNRDDLIAQLKRRTPLATHPINVANRLIAQLKKNESAERIAADIVANESFDMKQLLRGNDKCVVNELNNWYVQKRQFYSLLKIQNYFSLFWTNAESVEIYVDCIKRMLTILGEMMKSTKSTPNMPRNRISEAMLRLLSSDFMEVCKLYRNNYAKAVSMKQLTMRKDLEAKFFSELRTSNAMIVLAVLLNMLLAVSGAHIRCSFFSTLHRSDTIAQMRSLLVYVGHNDLIVELQRKCYNSIQKFLENTNSLLTKLRQEPVGQTVEFAHIVQRFDRQRALVDELKDLIAREEQLGLKSLHKSCFSCDDMSTIRRLWYWKMNPYGWTHFLERMCIEWELVFAPLYTVNITDRRIGPVNPWITSSKLVMIQAATNDSANNYACISHTRKLAELFRVDDGEQEEEEEALQTLHSMLRPYYNNIFILNNKWKALEAFCKQRHLAWSSAKAHKMRKDDEKQLQALYDDRRGTLRTILTNCGIRAVDDLTRRVTTVVPYALASLNNIQLELCEMLKAVGYFRDNFHFLKHRIPMIQGKNYRNLLAHDPLSYYVLMDSSDEILVINAFIFAYTEVDLFARRQPWRVHLRFPTVEDTNRWNEQQRQLLAALEADDARRIHTAMRAGGEIKNLFYIKLYPERYSKNVAWLTKLVDKLHVFCRPASSVITLFRRYFDNFEDCYNASEAIFKRALVHHDFDVALQLRDTRKPLWLNFFVWPDLVSKLSGDLVRTEASLGWQPLIKAFLDHGNDKCLREVIPLYDEFSLTDSDNGPLVYAILRGMYLIAKLLLQKTIYTHPVALELAIVLHWNDLLSDIASKTDVDRNVYINLLQTAIKARNAAAVVFLLSHGQQTTDALGNCYLTSAYYGRHIILKLLLDNFPLTDHIALSIALHSAAIRQHWQCFRLLLDADASVARLMPDYRNEGANVLLMLTMQGKVTLIRKIKSIDRSIYGKAILHPIAVAVRHNTASVRMIRALRKLQFRWLDSSTILHEAIRKGCDHPAWRTVWGRIENELSSCTGHDRLSCSVHMLKRWKMIAFVEEMNMGRSSLTCAINCGDIQTLRKLLSRFRTIRKYEGKVVLGDIVLQIGTVVVRLGRNESHATCNIACSCDEMIHSINNLRSGRDALRWQEFTTDAGANVQIAILNEIIGPRMCLKIRHMIRNSNLLSENLHDFRTLTNAFFPKNSVICAKFSQQSRTTHFLRVAKFYCAYDTFSTESAAMQSNSLEAYVMALKSAIALNCNLEIVQLLVQTGANPLLSSERGGSPIYLALTPHCNPAIALYLIDHCIQCDLRDANGFTLSELVLDSANSRIIHAAVTSGHQSAVARLLQFNIDVKVANIHGHTPAHLASFCEFVNLVPIMEMLLEYDREPLDMVDAQGRTPLCLAAFENSSELLDLIMRYNPNLTIPGNAAALGVAIERGNVQWAKRFLQCVTERSVRGIMKLSERDPVVSSLRCNDFELSKALLEYELEHSLEAATVEELPRIETVLNSSSGVSEDMTGSKEFLSLLRSLVTTLTKDE